MLTDLAAGTRQPFSGWSDSAEILLLVTEPSAKGLLSTRRLAKLALRPQEKRKKQPPKQPQVMLVANKLRSKDDLNLIQQGTKALNLPIIAEIPYDKDLATAEQFGQAVLDYKSTASTVQAIEKLADQLLELTRNGENQSKPRKAQ